MIIVFYLCQESCCNVNRKHITIPLPHTRDTHTHTHKVFCRTSGPNRDRYKKSLNESLKFVLLIGNIIRTSDTNQ
jgi:hypothetical protein